MNYRISTNMMYQQSISTMLAKQAKLAHTQQQLASGQRLVTAKDDPVAAGTAVGLTARSPNWNASARTPTRCRTAWACRKTH